MVKEAYRKGTMAFAKSHLPDGNYIIVGVMSPWVTGMYEQKIRMLNFNELVDMYKNNVKFVLVDARSLEDYDKSHLPGAISIPLEDIGDYADRLDRNEKIITYCGGFHCPASTEAAKELMKLGFKDVNDYKGGIQEWTEKGYPTESS